MRTSGFGSRRAEVQTRDCRHVSCWSCYLICVSVGRSDSLIAVMNRILPFVQSPRVCKILNASAVLIVSVNKSVNEAHCYDPMLETSKEHPADQVMEKMASPRKRRSMIPNRREQILPWRTLVVMGE